jgi:hypothetical protein
MTDLYDPKLPIAEQPFYRCSCGVWQPRDRHAFCTDHGRCPDCHPTCPRPEMKPCQ